MSKNLFNIENIFLNRIKKEKTPEGKIKKYNEAVQSLSGRIPYYLTLSFAKIPLKTTNTTVQYKCFTDRKMKRLMKTQVFAILDIFTVLVA